MNLPKLNTLKIFKVTILLFTLFVFSTNKVVSAASIYLNPATGSIETKSFSIDVTLDTQDSSQITDVNLQVLFDTNFVEVESVNTGLFDTYQTADFSNINGVVNVQASNNTPFNQNSILAVATINFTTKPNTQGMLTNFQIDNTSSNITDSNFTSVSYTSSDASLLIDTNTISNNNNNQNSNMVSNNSTMTALPETGTTYYLQAIIIFFMTLVISFTIRKYAVTKL